MKRYRGIVVAQIVLICCLLSGCTSAKKEVVRLAVAANMQYTVEALLKAYKAHADTEFELVVGASGKLTQQIIHGAPYAMLISADSSYPMALQTEVLAALPPKPYARGILVLWTNRDDMQLTDWKALLIDKRVKHIALPNPKTAPYGKAALFLLQHSGLYDQLAPKMVTAESISQASQFIASGSADIGFTAKAIVLSPQMRHVGKFIEIPDTFYPPIVQSAVLLRNEQPATAEKALAFYDFLYSDEAKQILLTFGYKEP